jgi:hypothetical protein
VPLGAWGFKSPLRHHLQRAKAQVTALGVCVKGAEVHPGVTARSQVVVRALVRVGGEVGCDDLEPLLRGAISVSFGMEIAKDEDRTQPGDVECEGVVREP